MHTGSSVSIPGVEPEAGLALPIGVALAAACGAAYAAVPAFNPWGVANPIALIALLFAVGGSAYTTVRLGKVRGARFSAPLALLLAGVCIASIFVATFLYRGQGQAFLPFHAARLASGQPLFGSRSFHLKGWSLALLWGLGSLAVIFTALVVAVVESEKPFCVACRTWASRPRWKFLLTGTTDADVRRLKADRSVRAVTLSRHVGGDRTLISVIRACRCGGAASLTVRSRRPHQEEQHADEVFDALRIDRADLDRLCAWAEAVAPAAAPPRPPIDIRPAPAPSGPQGPREPFAESPAPPASGHRSYARSGGTHYASDCVVDNDYTRALRRRLKTGDWQAAEEALRAQQHPDDLAFVAEAIASWWQTPPFFEYWAANAPESPARLLCLGIHTVQQAWTARGAGWIPKNVGKFLALLSEAEAHLHAAADLAPRDPTPWGWLIYAGKGLGRGRDDILSYLRELRARAPQQRQAHLFALDYFYPKWHGAPGEAIAFARKVAAGAAPGSGLHTLIAEAHLQAAYEASGYKNDDKALRAHLSAPPVADEIARADAACFRPGSPERMDTPRSRALFAYVLWKAGRPERAGEHLRLLGRSTPWGPFVPGMLIFSPNTLTRARRECLVRG